MANALGRKPAASTARETRDCCAQYGVAFHFKQFQKVHLPVLDGRQHAEMPE